MKFAVNLKNYVPSNTSFNALNAQQQIADLTNALLEARQKISTQDGMILECLHYIRNQQAAKPAKKAPESKL